MVVRYLRNADTYFPQFKEKDDAPKWKFITEAEDVVPKRSDIWDIAYYLQKMCYPQGSRWRDELLISNPGGYICFGTEMTCAAFCGAFKVWKKVDIIEIKD